MPNPLEEGNIRKDAAKIPAAPATANPANPAAMQSAGRHPRKNALCALARPARTLLALAVTFALACLLGGCSSPTEMDEPSPKTPVPSVEQTAEENTEDAPETLPATDNEADEAPVASEMPDEADASDGIEAGNTATDQPTATAGVPRYRDLPAYEGSPYVYVNGGEPAFTADERAASFGTERYGDLDDLGRCTGAFAVVGAETMPTEKRGSIGSVKPSGWQIAKYDFVDGKYLYNRCHLLGFQLTAENANTRNLITGTRYLNVDGMLPFENAVADYIHATGNHVLMRVSPVFENDELVARGVHMMAESLEDDGDGVSFNVFCYNVQPGVVIDYATGDNLAADDATPLPDVSGAADASADKGAQSSAKGASGGDAGSKGIAEYVLNTNSKKFHVPSCSSVDQMSAKNRQDVEDTRENIIAQGYDPCKRCNP